ncbi:MAG: hypothetical protein IPG60_08215 [Bacteroidetes bacterium]|nr:hypothetical protein [Bacteroidota bacterium]
MEKIIQLVKTLNPNEVRAIKRFFASSSRTQINHRQLLFNNILNGKVNDENTGSKTIGRTSGDPAFIMLKKRLKDDIMKVLVTEEGSKKFNSKYFEARYKCRLMIIEADLLLSRGVSLLGEEILKKSLVLAEQYELTNEALILYDLLQAHFGIKAGPEKYLEYSNKNKNHLVLSQKKFEAQDYFRQLTMPQIFSTNKNYLYKDQSALASKELEKLAIESNSDEIQSWYLRSNIFYFHTIGDYISAREYATDFLDLANRSPVLNSKDNIGGAYMQLSIVNLLIRNYNEAFKFAENATKYFVKQSMNQVNALSFLFLAAIYDKQFDSALTIVKKVSEFKSITQYKSIEAKWNYYKANLLFAQGKYDDALALLQRENELISDKSGWRLGFKILEMMCIIELGYYDWLDFRIETFRKLLSDVKNENVARPKLILQIIKGFIKHMYDFKNTTNDLKEHFDLLASNDAEYKWDPIGYEVIPFHEWWFNKISSNKIVA